MVRYPGLPVGRVARRRQEKVARTHIEKVARSHLSHYGALMAANREYSRVSALTDLDKSPCILPAALKTRSTPAEEAGAARYCLTILHRLGHLVSLACHHFSTLQSRSTRGRHPRHQRECEILWLSSSCSTAGITARRAAYIAKGAMRSAAENQQRPPRRESRTSAVCAARRSRTSRRHLGVASSPRRPAGAARRGHASGPWLGHTDPTHNNPPTQCQ